MSSLGVAECNRVCVEKPKNNKRVYSPFEKTIGKCKATNPKDYKEMLAEKDGFTLNDCRFRCEIMGEMCNAFFWGPAEQSDSDVLQQNTESASTNLANVVTNM